MLLLFKSSSLEETVGLDLFYSKTETCVKAIYQPMANKMELN